ncbi:MAG: tyrosine-type recombinase/integrase, partial [Firmicutes bacterium]|nr:tyrosine-type recombinase/integrase [Bacillota bacterium]
MSAEDDWEETGFVFTTSRGTPLDPSQITPAFKKLLTKAGLPTTWRLHDLRHAMATHWLASGINPKVVSERLGHASVAFTLQVYAHVLPNQQADAAERVARDLMGSQIDDSSG